VPLFADLLRVRGSMHLHLRRFARDLDGPQASSPLPPLRRRGSGSGPLADGTPSPASNSPDVRRPHRLSVAGADLAARPGDDGGSDGLRS